MPINDDNIGWNRKRLWLPATAFLGFLESAGVNTSLGAGTPVYAETLSAIQLADIAINAAGNEIHNIIPIPWDMDLTQPMRFRVWFTHNSTDADTPIWKVHYLFYAKQAALASAITGADEVVTFDAHTVSTTAGVLEITAWAESNSETLWRDGDFAIGFAVECDSLGSAGANEIGFFGLEIQYVVAAAPNRARQVTNNQPISSSTDPNI